MMKNSKELNDIFFPCKEESEFLSQRVVCVLDVLRTGTGE